MPIQIGTTAGAQTTAGHSTGRRLASRWTTGASSVCFGPAQTGALVTELVTEAAHTGGTRRTSEDAEAPLTCDDASLANPRRHATDTLSGSSNPTATAK